MRERGNDDLGTPAWLIDRVKSMGPIALDPCSNPWSLVGALTEWSLENGNDGLAQPWGPVANIDGSVFVNPPYSKPLPWCRRAAEAAQSGSEVFVLVRNDPTTKWAAELAIVSSAWCHFTKRIRFEGGKHAAGMMASTMWYAGSRPYLFAHVFQGLGDVGVRLR